VIGAALHLGFERLVGGADLCCCVAVGGADFCCCLLLTVVYVLLLCGTCRFVPIGLACRPCTRSSERRTKWRAGGTRPYRG
jgi:hypothetical protein